MSAPASPVDETNPIDGVLDAVTTAVTWALNNPVPTAIIAGWIGTIYGWKQLRTYYAQRGRAIPPLGFTIRRVIRFALIEDAAPVIPAPKALSDRLSILQWRRVYPLALIAGLALTALDRSGLGLTILVSLALTLTSRARKVFRIRWQILMQMFSVAAAECRYPRGSELNPWGYINVTKWIDMYRPGETIVTYPAGYQSEELKTREKFERNFSGSVSDENSFTYQWESARNRVIASPTPFLPRVANYPRVDDHPWNEFPLGITWGGEEAVLDLQVFPHCLLAGPTGSGKAIQLSTRIATPSGWTTMGDIRPGDQVFDENGQPCTVTWVSDVNEHPDLYEVEFSDGSVIVADAAHLWWTETRQVREVAWSAAKKDPVRRPLLSSDRVAALRAAAGVAGRADVITLREAAAIAGVRDTAGWLREVASSVGHEGEEQVEVCFHYPAQTVTQMQMVWRYPARAVWAALARHEPKVPGWYVHRSECARRAEAAGADDWVGADEIAGLLGLPARRVTGLLRRKGVVPLGAGGRGVSSVFSAREAWGCFASVKLAAEDVAWLSERSRFAEMAVAAGAEDSVSTGEIAAELKVTGVEATAWMKRLGVTGVKSRERVTLNVGEKHVHRKGNVARTYPTVMLLSALADRGERPANDQRHKSARGEVRTTIDILESLRTKGGQANHSIPVAKPLALPEADLPIHPYLLGVWLGDGLSRHGDFCGIDHEIAERISALGYTTNERLLHDADEYHPNMRIWRVDGLRDDLDRLGLLKRHTSEGSTKRIPLIYLRASVEQRMELLRGLMDTDGSVESARMVAFNNSEPDLIQDVLELVRSLGYRATVNERMGAYSRNGTRTETRTAYRVTWSTSDDVFGLTRKSQEHAARCANAKDDQRIRSRYIVDVRQTASEPARCISVDSPSRLFLAGEAMIPTHNSVTQRTILMHCLQMPDEWKVIGIDPKMVELGPYKDFPNVLKIATQLEESVALLESAENEMKRRYEEMTQTGVNHFKNLPPDPQTGKTPPALLIMIDETYALLAPEGIKSDEGKERDAMHARATVLIGSIARLGRAAGVHLILATQRPDAKVLPGETRNNALALDTPIATPSGWSTMGDLAVGDLILDQSGNPVEVVSVTDVIEDGACFEVEFAVDGAATVLVADGDHEWLVVDDQAFENAAAGGSPWDHARLVDTFGLAALVLAGVGVWIPREGTDAADWFTVTAVRPVDSVPVRCVTVSSDRHLFLAGTARIPTHNCDARIACARMDTTPSLMVLDSDAATRLPLIKGRSVLRLGGDVMEYQGYFLPIEQVEPAVAAGLAHRAQKTAEAAAMLPDGIGDDSGSSVDGDSSPVLVGAGGPLTAPGVDPVGAGGVRGRLASVWAARRAAAAQADQELAAVQGSGAPRTAHGGYPVGSSAVTGHGFEDEFTHALVTSDWSGAGDGWDDPESNVDGGLFPMAFPPVPGGGAQGPAVGSGTAGSGFVLPVEPPVLPVEPPALPVEPPDAGRTG
jgi:hypothetical protein